ncbi:hypothetical protein Taro_023997 [Colocasia esculenta]|uniref:Uncharacterized protein n=1 Tax=Colocasia esculenta TaxID=4460 RepID=A0A843V819_COLES|nr:hypothetical protein [Colocasia esculenta]
MDSHMADELVVPLKFRGDSVHFLSLLVLGRVLELATVVWRSPWWLRSCGTPTPSRSSSPSRLLRPAQTVHLKSTKGDYDVQEEEQVEDGNASEL